MKRVILLIAFLAVGSSTIVGQSGHAGQEKNLRGLKGLRLVVMCPRAGDLDEAERLAILALVEADATAKFETAGIPPIRVYSWIVFRRTNWLTIHESHTKHHELYKGQLGDDHCRFEDFLCNAMLRNQNQSDPGHRP